MKLGEGIINWPSKERQTDRYGSVMLATDFPTLENYVELDKSCEGQIGRLECRVIEARQSGHMGDIARGISTKTPFPGDVIVLGNGTLFFEKCEEADTVGVYPGDAREVDWMDPKKLYTAIHQTVELFFIPL